MKFEKYSLALILTAGLAVGCEEAKDAAVEATEATKEAAGTAAEKTGDAVDALTAQAAEAGEALKEAGSEALESGQKQLDEAVESTKQAVDDAVESGKEKLQELTAPAEEAPAVPDTPEAPETPDTPETPEAPTAVDTDATTGLSLGSLTEGMSLDNSQVDAAIAKVKELIGEKNYDTAAQWIGKLESVQVPEGYADQISGLKDLLEKAQGAGDALKGLGIGG